MVQASDPTPSPSLRPRAGSARGPMASLHDAARRGDVLGVQAALHLAARYGQIDARDEYKHTALHEAAVKGHAALVGALVGSGAAVGAVEGYGRTALHWAAWNGHAAVVEALAGAGASVEAVDKDGNTPLSLAAYFGQTEAAAALLDAGADATRPTDQGKTAAEWARERGHPAVVELIEAHLAAPKAAAQKKAKKKAAQMKAPAQPDSSTREGMEVRGLMGRAQVGNGVYWFTAEWQDKRRVYVQEGKAARRAHRLCFDDGHSTRAPPAWIIE
eukprot:COSAG01_NODE_3131_length_6533_cov_6.407212_1_plen_272_part_10